MVKNPPASAGNSGSVPGWGRSPGGGHGSPLQGSCLANPMDREAWRATVHEVSKESDRLTARAHTEHSSHYTISTICECQSSDIKVTYNVV